MNLVEQMKDVVEKIDITIDLGNANYKMLVNEKQIIDSSNVEEVAVESFGAYKVNNKFYIFGEGAAAKYNTNKIIEEKRALLGRALYSVLPNGKEVEITTLLPLSLYVENENKEKFKKMLEGNYEVVNPNGYVKTFCVKNVNVCCEGFSSLMVDADLLKQALYLVDFGGVDITGCYVNRTPVVNQSFSIENGMNIFYTELAKVLTSKFLESYSNKDAELVYQKYEDLNEDLKQVIDDFAKTYIQKNVYQKLNQIGYKPLIHKLVLTGGGAVALERYLKQDKNIVIIDDALWSNVKGANIINKRRAR